MDKLNERCDIFISYRHDDLNDACHLLTLLRTLSYDVFWDQDLHQRQMPDNEFGIALDKMISDCKDFILILTKNTFAPKKKPDNTEDWLVHEIRAVYERHKDVRIFYYSADGTAFPPKEKNVPGIIKDLTSVAHCYPLVLSSKRADDKLLAQELQQQLVSKPQRSDAQQFSEQTAYTIDDTELNRLKKQSYNTRFCDKSVLKEILDENPVDRKYNVLDIGCADGSVGRTRFEDDRFQSVLGIDRDGKCINAALDIVRNDPAYEKYNYRCCDLLDEEQLRKVLDLERKKYDIIFATQVLHHLRLPGAKSCDSAAVACLSLLCEYLADDGYIVIRTTDDDMKIAGSEEDTRLIRDIVKLTYANPKVTADRKTGRKLYSWLCGCGINDIRIRTFGRSTEGLYGIKKLALFQESFEWRGNTYDETGKQTLNYKMMMNNLNALRSRFINTDFWYCEFEFIAIGHLKNNQ